MYIYTHTCLLMCLSYVPLSLPLLPLLRPSPYIELDNDISGWSVNAVLAGGTFSLTITNAAATTNNNNDNNTNTTTITNNNMYYV